MTKKQFKPRPRWLSLSTAVCTFYIGEDGTFRRHQENSIGIRLMRSIFTEFDEGNFIDNEEKERLTKQLDQNRAEWHRSYLPAFNHAVAAGSVALYARKGSELSPYKRLDAVDWLRFQTIDWQHGNATYADGSEFFAIHASIRSGKSRGRKQKIDWDCSVKSFVFKYLDRFSGDECNYTKRGFKADIERAVLSFIENTLDGSVSESVVRDRTSRLISAYRRLKAGY